MYLFDHVEERTIKDIYYAYAINKKDNQAYLLRNAIISTSKSAMNGLRLTISCHPEEYVYRGKFNTAEEMEAFKDRVQQLLFEVSKKNSSFPSASDYAQPRPPDADL